QHERSSVLARRRDEYSERLIERRQWLAFWKHQRSVEHFILAPRTRRRPRCGSIPFGQEPALDADRRRRHLAARRGGFRNESRLGPPGQDGCGKPGGATFGHTGL